VNKKPLIFVTNDDGIDAPGIAALIEVAKKFGRVFVIAPSKPQSGVSHAITIREPVFTEKVDLYPGIEAHKCSGTPVDCVKFGITKLLGVKPDLVVSGINHGSNASINVLYSGTIAAAMEGIIEGVPSVGFSFNRWEPTDDLELCKMVAGQVISAVLNDPLPEGILLNVNIPDIPAEEFKGIKICRQAKAYWLEEYIEVSSTNGHNCFMLAGEFLTNDDRDNTDLWALANNYASVVPIKLDITAHSVIPTLLNMEKLTNNPDG
jgi:5'-nucleotidase